jgi:hypothetical protein
MGFRSLDDSSNLTDLHVYGDLLTFYSYRLPYFVSIAEAGAFYNELSLFEHRLLTLYVSYVLTRARFYDSVIMEMERRYTTKFSDKDWIEIFGILPPGELDEVLEPWDWEYKNERGEKLRVVFVKVLMGAYDFKSGRSYSSADVLVRYIGGNKDSERKRVLMLIRTSRK